MGLFQMLSCFRMKVESIMEIQILIQSSGEYLKTVFYMMDNFCIASLVGNSEFLSLSFFFFLDLEGLQCSRTIQSSIMLYE